MGRNGLPEVQASRVPRSDLFGEDRTNTKQNQKFKKHIIVRPYSLGTYGNMCHYNHLYKVYTVHK